MELKIEGATLKGTRILTDRDAWRKRYIINKLIELVEEYDYHEVMFPILLEASLFDKKVGEENQNMMYQLTDAGNRKLCLAPEYTALAMQLPLNQWKYEKDKHIFYVGECFRGERPSAGRYRQFTQFGVEIINPTTDYYDHLVNLAEELVIQVMGKLNAKRPVIEVNRDVTRGLDYYEGGKGFEISCPQLGAQKQICGGGSYKNGIGFALGVDRLMLID